MSEKGPREDVVVTEERDKKGEKKLGGLAELENTASGRTRRLLAWIGGGVAAIIATTATAYVTGLLNLILPGPDEAICNFVQAPIIEKSLTGLLPGVLVAAFSGVGGRDAARDLSEEIRLRTGLPITRTCIIMSLSSGADASHENVAKALDDARQLARKRGARVIVLGEMRSNGAAELAVTNTAEFEGRSDARHSTVQLTGVATSSGVIDVKRFIDDILLAALRDWASLAALRLQYETPSLIASDTAEGEAESVADLAEYDPPVRWDAMRKDQSSFWGYALRANAYVARWHERCQPADRWHHFSRLLASSALSESDKNREPDVALAALEAYLHCEGDPTVPQKTRGREGLAALWPYVQKVAKGTEIRDVEQLIEKEKPWPYDSDTVKDWSANLVLAKSLLKAVHENSDSPDNAVALAAALNFLKADVRLSRREGDPTERERQANSKCQERYGYSIEQSESWQLLVSQGIDPFPLILEIELSEGSDCRTVK